MNYVEEFCRDIAILSGGSIVCSGPIRDIKRSYDRLKIILLSPEAEKVEQYIKTGAKDIATAAERAHDTVTVTLVSADKKMELLKRLSQENLNLDRFDVYEPSLNDIFVECTEGSI
jgi:ABC-2 type transport system ATP-binding protein